MTIEQLVLRVAGIIAACGTIWALIAWIVKTVKNFSNGIKCMLRSAMLNTYYKHSDEDAWRQYEAENFGYMYEAYKSLGGNSFIETIHDETKKWEVRR